MDESVEVVSLDPAMSEYHVVVDVSRMVPGQVVGMFVTRREDGSLHGEARFLENAGVMAFGEVEAEEVLGWQLVGGVRSVQQGAGVDVGPVWTELFASVEEENRDEQG